jgi:hypothetical protein
MNGAIIQPLLDLVAHDFREPQLADERKIGMTASPSDSSYEIICESSERRRGTGISNSTPSRR